MNKKDMQTFFHISNLIEDVNDKEEDEKMSVFFDLIKGFEDSLSDMMMGVHRRLGHLNNYCLVGEIRNYDVFVGNKKCLDYKIINIELIELFKKEPKTWQEIKEWHIKFENIHPFGDGNGRVGRFLMLIQLYKNDLLIPEIFLNEEKFDENRQEYYKFFKTK